MLSMPSKRFKVLYLIPILFILTLIITLFLASKSFGDILFSPLLAYNYLNEKVIHQRIKGSSFYYRGFNGIYYDNTGGCLDICLSKNFAKLEKVDPNTFRLIPDMEETPSHYAKDQNRVYMGSKVIVSANPQTFTVILSRNSIEEGSEQEKTIYRKDIYAYDKNNKYKNGVLIDPSNTLEISRFEQILNSNPNLLR